MIAACHLKVAAAEETAAAAAAIDLHIIGSVKRRGNSAELALACLHQLCFVPSCLAHHLTFLLASI